MQSRLLQDTVLVVETSTSETLEPTQESTETPTTVDFVLVSDCSSETRSILGTVGFSIISFVFCLFIMQAFAWWRVTRDKNFWIKVTLVLSLAIVITTAAFSFLQLNLRVLFALSLLSQYLAVCCLTIVLNNLIHTTAAAMRHKVRWLLVPLHLLYCALFVLGQFGDMAAVCTAKVPLPMIFFLKDALFLVFFVGLVALQYNGFLIDWNHAGQKQIKLREHSQSKTAAQRPDLSAPSPAGETVSPRHSSPRGDSTGKSRDLKASPESEEKEPLSSQEVLFKFQTSRLVCYSIWCLFLNMMTVVVLLMLSAVSMQMGCSAGNASASGSGNNLPTFQGCSTAVFVDLVTRFAIISAAFITRVVFVKTRKQVDMTLTQTIKELGTDYRRGLSLLNPQPFSDHEEDEESRPNAPVSVVNSSGGKSWVVSKKKSEIELAASRDKNLTTVGDNEDADTLPTDRLETEDGLLIGHRPAPARSLKTITEEDPSQVSLSYQTGSVKKQNSAALQSSTKKRDYPVFNREAADRRQALEVQTKAVSQPTESSTALTRGDNILLHKQTIQPPVMEVDQGHDPARSSSSQNGQRKLTPERRQQADLGMEKKQSSCVRVHFADNNREMDDQHAKIPRQQTGLVPRREAHLASSGGTGQSEEQFEAPKGFLDDDEPLRPSTGPFTRNLTLVDQDVNGQDLRTKNRYSKQKSTPVTKTESGLQSLVEEQSAPHIAPLKYAEGTRQSLVVSSIEILPLGTLQLSNRPSKAPMKQTKLMNQKSPSDLGSPEDSDVPAWDKDEVLLDESLRDNPANQTQPPKEKSEPDTMRNAHDNHLNYDLFSEAPPFQKRLTFGPVVGSKHDFKNQPKTPSPEKMLNRHKDQRQPRQPQQPAQQEPTPSPFKEAHDRDRDVSEPSALQDASSWLDDDGVSSEEGDQGHSSGLRQHNPVTRSSIGLQNNPMDEVKNSMAAGTATQSTGHRHSNIDGGRGDPAFNQGGLSGRHAQGSNRVSALGQQYFEHNQGTEMTISPISQIQTTTNNVHVTSDFTGHTSPMALPTYQEQVVDQTPEQRPFSLLARKVDEKADKGNGGGYPGHIVLTQSCTVKLVSVQEVQLTDEKNGRSTQPRHRRGDLSMHNMFRGMQPGSEETESFEVGESVQSSRFGHLDKRPTIGFGDLGGDSARQMPGMTKVVSEGFGLRQSDSPLKQAAAPLPRNRTDRNLLGNQRRFTGHGATGHDDNKIEEDFGAIGEAPADDHPHGAQSHFQSNKQRSFSDVSDLPDTKYKLPMGFGGDKPSFIAGHHDQGGSFISQGHSFINGGGGGGGASFIQRNKNLTKQLTPVVEERTQPQAQPHPLHAYRRRGKRRIVRSRLQAKVVSMAIVPKVSAFTITENELKLQKLTQIVQQQHGVQSVRQDEEIKTGTGSNIGPYRVNEVSSRNKPDVVNRAVHRVDLRTHSTTTKTKTLYSMQAVAADGEPKNRFMKNILKKHGQGRGQQTGMQKKKHVHFTIGTGTRGQANRDEVADNYLSQVNIESSADHQVSEEELARQRREEQRMQMIMGGNTQFTREAELVRDLEAGPSRGDGALKKQLNQLQRQQRERDLITKRPGQQLQSRIKPSINMKLPDNMTNPYEDHKAAAAAAEDSAISASDIYLQTSNEQETELQNPYDFKPLGTSPSPMVKK